MLSRSSSAVLAAALYLTLWLASCGAPPEPESPAESTPPPSILEALAEGLPEMMERATVPGLSIAVVEEGVIETRAFGVATTETGAAVTEETVFETASLSKPVFAYAVLRLVERGELDLDRPLSELSDYQGTDFAEIQQDERIGSVTPRHVLTHTTGFPNWRGGSPLGFRAEPGEFGYSGEGFVYLQTAVEAVTGRPVEEVIRQEVLDPLGMKSSSYVWQESYDSLAASGHDFLGEAVEKNKPEDPNTAGSLHTTAGDFALFLREMLKPTLLPEGTVNAMLTPSSTAADGVSWGLGWGLEEVEKPDGGTETYFWHWGNNGIFRCFTAGSRTSQRAFVLFTNAENGQTFTNTLLARFAPGEHPAPAWQEFPDWDSPTIAASKRLVLAGDEGARAVREAYDALRAELPAEAFAENSLNRLGYRLLQRGAHAGAVEVFRIITELYPDSWNVWDSLGEGLMESGETEAAIEAYERSLELNPDNGNGRRMLERLRGESS